jgi:hypothetical protein
MEELDTMIAEAMKKFKIKLFDGRPRRAFPINKDDIINLQIALHCSKDLDEFLEKI